MNSKNKKLQFLIFLVVFIATGACERERPHPAPYQDFHQVGLFGHGEDLLAAVGLNFWGLTRRCDSCHAVPTSIHPDLGTCNSCHQPHFEGWKEATVAIYHNESLPMAGMKHHMDLACTECHSSMESRAAYRNEMECISCHSHTSIDIEFAHELMDEFNMATNYKNGRCVDCHAKTGTEYTTHYDSTTGELL